MNKWVRFEHNGNIHFGKMDDTHITHYQGDMFTENEALGRVFALDEVTLLAPCTPTKIIALVLSLSSFRSNFYGALSLIRFKEYKYSRSKFCHICGSFECGVMSILNLCH